MFTPLRKNQVHTVTIERLGPDGKGIVDLDGCQLTVPGTVPGDKADVRLVSIKRSRMRGVLERLIIPGIPRIEPPCEHFRYCGGCTWQDVPYDAQCRLKAGLVEEALSAVPGIDPPGPVTVEPSPDIYHYRNKMEFTIDSPPRLEGRVLVGLHEPGKFDRVFDLMRCHIQSERANAVVAATREFIDTHGLIAYGLKSHRGLLRFLVVREGTETGDLMVVIVTSDDPFPQAADYAACLTAAVPSITSVLRSVSRSRAGVATGGEYTVLHGDGRITDRIGPYTFGISPDAFFQTNTRQAARLYECIRDFCGLTGSERLLDLYCGTGTIGIFCAGESAHVTGVELVEDAVADARTNAVLNGIENITFIAAPVEAVIGEELDADPFDVAICDPPRAGIHPDGLDALCRMRIPRLVYVSCNVKQLPRDFEALALAGYRITAVRAFDMSPHTPHIETVVRLDLG